jgi:hypothetical protein
LSINRLTANFAGQRPRVQRAGHWGVLVSGLEQFDGADARRSGSGGTNSAPAMPAKPRRTIATAQRESGIAGVPGKPVGRLEGCDLDTGLRALVMADTMAGAAEQIERAEPDRRIGRRRRPPRTPYFLT